MATKPTLTIGDLVPKATARGLELPAGVAKALLTHASLDEARVMMCGLGIDGTGDSAWLCATDGCRLVRMPIAGTVPDGIGTIITPEEVERAIARAEAKDVIGTGEEGAPLIVLPWCKPSEIRFVPTSQVVPVGDKRGEGEAPWFDPAYLAGAFKIGETFAKLTRTRAQISMGVTHMGASLDPMRVDVNASGTCIAQIVIMPMRADGCCLPATHTGAAPYVEMTQDQRDACATTVNDRPIGKRTRAPRKGKPDSETAHMRAEAA